MIRTFSVILLLSTSYCFASDCSILFAAIERQDVASVIQYFDDLRLDSHADAIEFIDEIHSHYTSVYGEQIIKSDAYVKRLHKCKRLYRTLFQNHNNSHYGECDVRYFSDTTSVLQCKKKKKPKKPGVEAEVHGSVVIGGVEVLGGALVWILPVPGAKQLGGVMIADGIRRTFDGLTIMDEENKKKQQSESQDAQT